MKPLKCPQIAKFAIFSFVFSLIFTSKLAFATSYWVQFGSPGKPNSSWDTADELLNYLQDNGIEATEIDRWKNGGWDGHIANFPFNNFDIKAEEGYFLKVNTDTPDFEAVLTNYTSSIPSSYSINVGWNLINFPKGFKSKYIINKAEDVCLNIGSVATEVSYTEPMEENLKPIDESPGYKSHKCGSNDNNFDIKEAHSYFIKADDYSTWEPVKKSKVYYVYWGPKGIPNDSWNRAEELLDKLNDKGINASEIQRWVNGGWDGHINNFPFNDFTVENGVGYAIAVTDPTDNLSSVLNNWTDTSSITYDLKASWNLISFPRALVEGNKDLSNASDICKISGVEEIRYNRYYEKGTDPQYTEYVCDSNDANFSIESGLAYFVKSNKNTSWTPSYTGSTSSDKKDNDKDDKGNKDPNSSSQNSTTNENTKTTGLVNNDSTKAMSAIASVAEPLGQVLGVDLTNLSFYDTMLLFIMFIVILSLLLVIIVLAVYSARNYGNMPSIREKIKGFFSKKSRPSTSESAEIASNSTPDNLDQ